MSKHQVVSHQVTQVWHGPVPDPATLIEFEKILPGAAERIFSLAEREATLRHEEKRTDVEEYHASVKRGQVFAFVVLMTVMIAACVCAVFNCEKIGVAIAAIGGAGIVSNFIWKK